MKKYIVTVRHIEVITHIIEADSAFQAKRKATKDAHLFLSDRNYEPHSYKSQISSVTAKVATP